MKMQLSPRDWQLLSDYLDGHLSPAEQQGLAERLRTDAGLREGLKNLRMTTTLLRSAPRRRVPHNFTLNPAAAARPSPAPGTWLSFFSFSSAVAVVLLLITFAVDLLPRAMPAAVRQPAFEQQSAAQDRQAATSAPTGGPVILWQPLQGSGGGNAPAGKGSSGPAPAPASPQLPAPTQVPPPALQLSAATAEARPPAAPTILPPTPTPDGKKASRSPTAISPPPAGAPPRAGDAAPTTTAAAPLAKVAEASPTPSPTLPPPTRIPPTQLPTQPAKAATLAAPTATQPVQDYTGLIQGIKVLTGTPVPAPTQPAPPEAGQQTTPLLWLLRLGLLALALAAGTAAVVLKIRYRN